MSMKSMNNHGYGPLPGDEYPPAPAAAAPAPAPSSARTRLDPPTVRPPSREYTQQQQQQQQQQQLAAAPSAGGVGHTPRTGTAGLHHSALAKQQQLQQQHLTASATSARGVGHTPQTAAAGPNHSSLASGTHTVLPGRTPLTAGTASAGQTPLAGGVSGAGQRSLAGGPGSVSQTPPAAGVAGGIGIAQPTFAGGTVGAGQTVCGGQTPLAGGASQLPLSSSPGSVGHVGQTPLAGGGGALGARPPLALMTGGPGGARPLSGTDRRGPRLFDPGPDDPSDPSSFFASLGDMLKGLRDEEAVAARRARVVSTARHVLLLAAVQTLLGLLALLSQIRPPPGGRDAALLLTASVVVLSGCLGLTGALRRSAWALHGYFLTQVPDEGSNRTTPGPAPLRSPALLADPCLADLGPRRRLLAVDALADRLGSRGRLF
jgi:hypothetical protein